MAWSGIVYAPYNSTTECVYALNGTYRRRIEADVVWNWGIDAPTDKPTLSAVTAEDSGITGTYNAKYSYARKEKQDTVVCESNPSLAAASTAAPSGEDLRVTFTAPIDDQVNCIRVYRTQAGGSDYYYDCDYNFPNGDYTVTQDWEETGGYFTGVAYYFTKTNTTDNTEDSFTWEEFRNKYALNDNQRRATVPADSNSYVDTDTADGSLGTAEHSDHNRPPATGTYVFGPTFDGTCFIIDNHKLYYSKTKQPEYWPSTYYVHVSSPERVPKCGVIFDKQPFVLTKDKIYFLYGTSSTTYLPKVTSAKTGTQSQFGAVGVEGYGIFHIGADGIYLFSPSTDYRHGQDIKITGAFEPIFRGEDANGVKQCGDLANSWLIYWDDKIYFGYPDPLGTYPEHILVFYLTEKRVGYFTRGEEMHAVTVDVENDRLLAADDSGYIWVLDDNTVTDDDGAAIEWEVQTKEYTLQTRRHFPRWVKYDVDASQAGSASGELYLDGVSHHTHTLSGDRNTRRRLVEVGNGNRCSIKVSGSGPVEIYAMESE